MSRLQTLLHRWPVNGLLRFAAALGLVALGIFVFSIMVPLPLSLIAAMSIGQVVGGVAFVCYLLAVLTDAARSPVPPPSDPSKVANVAVSANADSEPPRNG